MKSLRCFHYLSVIAVASIPAVVAFAQVAPLDLRGAAIWVTDDNPVVATAGRMLREEIEQRTGIPLPVSNTAPESDGPRIALCVSDRAPNPLQPFVVTMKVPEKADGFSIDVDSGGNTPTVVLAGYDEGGVLFAVGRLLLNLRMEDGKLALSSDYQIATAPRFPYRGHQIGFRNLSHCYDAWTAQQYEQYMRDMAVFGANSFETTSFGNPNEKDGPHAKLTKGQMAAEWSRICQEYGYDFWMFSGALGGTGESDEELEESLERRLDLLSAVPHLDHLYPTGGDGHSEHRRPDEMIEWTGRLAEEARKIHPNLGVWVSNQGFDPEQNNWFFDYLQREQPEWLTGVVYGAWTRILADEQRARTPEQYPIRRYSDIGHCVRGQYPVAGWDRALARTLGREPFAPRPQWHARIHNLFDDYCDGFVTYSDGVGDDVNKVVWTALGWDPDRPVDDIMLDYSRYFFGWDIAEDVREGLYAFERAFEGPLSENVGVVENFNRWRSLEDGADEALLGNWRFQECLLRAYYDHYTRLRLLKAMEIEDRACAVLRQAPQVGVEQVIEEARAILAESDQDRETGTLRARIVELGAALFDSIGAQLDVEHYQARNSERGAVLDFLDIPLNNKLWYEHEFDAILAGDFTASMPEDPLPGDVRLQRLARVANWEDPGPGGYYDDLGCSWKQTHLVKPKPLWDDPAGVTTPREDHTLDEGSINRLSWLDLSEALNQTPLTLRYADLDPNASYRLRATYLGRYRATIRLVADDHYEIHGAYGHTMQGVRYTISRDSAAQVAVAEDEPEPVVTPLEFPIPREATADGSLELTWQRVTGRGTQVAEVWLIKDPE